MPHPFHVPQRGIRPLTRYISVSGHLYVKFVLLQPNHLSNALRATNLATMALQGKLSFPKRYITTHNDSGRAIVDTSVTENAPFYKVAHQDAAFAQCYVTSGFPVQLNEHADVKVYQEYLTSPPGLVVSNGTVLRYVDISPGSVSPMHRTLSLDYGVVLEGEIELLLDSGETRLMNRGDICIQRATMHAWRNTSETNWARMLYILQPTQSVTAGGNELGEDYGTMKGVKPST